MYWRTDRRRGRGRSARHLRQMGERLGRV